MSLKQHRNQNARAYVSIAMTRESQMRSSSSSAVVIADLIWFAADDVLIERIDILGIFATA